MAQNTEAAGEWVQKLIGGLNKVIEALPNIKPETQAELIHEWTTCAAIDGAPGHTLLVRHVVDPHACTLHDHHVADVAHVRHHHEFDV